MTPDRVLNHILQSRLIAVVRHDDPSPLVDAVAALAAGGVTVSEITLTVPGALDVIRQVANIESVLPGAGTVLTVEQAHAAHEAGARFIVTPTLNLPVIAWCKSHNVAVMAGAFTPTEALAAHDAGADIVKIFPAEVLGPAFFKAMRGPLPFVKLMPTGGVDLTTARAFLDAGAVCLGVGGQLVDPKLLHARDFTTLTARARAFAAIVEID